MKTCPSCNRSYTDEALNFCLQDGTPLVIEADLPSETTRYSTPRQTDPPPTEIYRPGPHLQPPPQVNQGAPYQARYSPMPQYTPVPVERQPRSNAVWWILGGLAVIVVLGLGAVIIFLAVASMSSEVDNNNNRVVNNNNSPNRNANGPRPNTNNSNANSIGNLPAAFSDDFSSQKWGTGSSAYGVIWYADGEYHMKSKEKTYFVMYGPSDDYDTGNARVRVTARNVDGVSPVSGYGLVVHGAPEERLRDYGFLIYTGENPKYEVVQHKGGTETALVPWTTSSIIRGGTSANQIEVRIKGSQLSFYINGQYATSITDTANFRRGRAGLYSSDAHEVAFDDLQINR